jgi:DNA polymerase-1
MLRLDRRLMGMQSAMLLQIHDELVFEAPPEERERVVEIIREEMATALGDRVSVPLGVDVCVGPNWLDAK